MQYIFIEAKEKKFQTEKKRKITLHCSYLFLISSLIKSWGLLLTFWMGFSSLACALVPDWNHCPVTALALLREVVMVMMRKTSIFFWKMKLIIAFRYYQWIAAEMWLYGTPSSSVYDVQYPRTLRSTSFKWICVYLLLYLWWRNTDLLITALKIPASC